MKNVTPTNNLKFNFPEIAKEWHPTKNGDLKPEGLVKYANRKAWWLCPKGHEYDMLISSRSFRKNNCPYCRGSRVSKENSLKILYPHIAKEWHPTKNGNLKPENVAKSSNIKVWWLCSKNNDHEWQARIITRTTAYNYTPKIISDNKLGDKRTVANRSIRTGCPYCSNRKVSSNNNIKFNFPEIAKEWHPIKNGDLKPENTTKSSNKIVWWLCPKGHDYEANVGSRTRGTGCPKCKPQSSRAEFRILSELETIFKKVDSRHKFKKTEIDIFIRDINLGIEYDGAYFHKNKEIEDSQKVEFLKKYSIKLIRVRKKPLEKLSNYDVIVESDELNKNDLNNIVHSIIIFCEQDQKKILEGYLQHKSFVNEQAYRKYLSYFPGPIPTKSLALTNPELVKEWHYKKNYPLTPDSFYEHARVKVWWLCSKDSNHEWFQDITNRTRKKYPSKCPFCSNRKVASTNNLKFNFPDIAKEWHPTKNGDLKPNDVVKHANRKAWWLCPKGHEYDALIVSRSFLKSGCPYCAGQKVSNTNNLKFNFPEIAKEWHPNKNGNLKPDEVAKGSNKIVWWLCKNGHEWQKKITHRTMPYTYVPKTPRKKIAISRSGCPKCKYLQKPTYR